MRNKFDRQLSRLNEMLIHMGELCETAIEEATKALEEGDMNRAKAVIAADEEIDQMEKDIESLCLKLLLQQQPVARDLRTISAALKMISDMERIGDQASDIADIAKFLEGSNITQQVHIRKMAEAAMRMLTDSIDSFVKKDLLLARQVIKEDDIVDDLFMEVKKELIQLIAENPEEGERCIDILMIAKYFERIGDHAVNIAEWVEYSVTGVHSNNE